MRKWTEKDLDLVKHLYPEGKKKELLYLLPTRTWFAIRQKATSLKFFRKDAGLERRKCDLSPLLNESPASMYWMGFLVADGHFNKLDRLVVALSKKDKLHLAKLARYLSCPIADYNNISRIACKHTAVVKKLKKKYVISNRKTYEPIKLPKVSNNKFVFFVIGFIDGDGRLGRQSSGRRDCAIILKMHRSWIVFLNELSLRLNSICKTPVVPAKINKKGYALLNIANSIVIKYMKRKIDKFDLPVLGRKWSTVDLSYVSRVEKNIEDMKIIKKLLFKGFSVREMSKKTGIRIDTIHKKIRVNPKYFAKTL